MNEEILNRLKDRIKLELENCDAELWPLTCSLRAEEEGYKKIEKAIILYVSKEAMPIGSAIALIEQELQHGKGEEYGK